MHDLHAAVVGEEGVPVAQDAEAGAPDEGDLRSKVEEEKRASKTFVLLLLHALFRSLRGAIPNFFHCFCPLLALAEQVNSLDSM